MKGITLAALLLLPLSTYASSYQCEVNRHGFNRHLRVI